jgi:hypothetical protein
MAVADTAPPAARGSGAVVASTLLGGGVAGLLDITYACTVWALRGVAPEQILKSVATGLLGPAAFDGGAAIALLGLALHFAMTILMALVFTLASLRLATLRALPIVWGLIYGGAIFCVMRYVVVPLSASPIGFPKWPSSFLELGVHMAFVGVPIALAARWLVGKPRK